MKGGYPMKYLTINGSPHKGNTWKLAELAKMQLLAADPSGEFKEIHLGNITLPFCTGCSACFRKGSEYCPHRSVMDEIVAEIDWADGIIFATSTFNAAPTALVKNLFDHLCYMLHRPYFFTKKALVITTTGGVGAKKAARSVAADLKGIGFNRVYLLSVAAHSWNDYQPGRQIIRQVDKTAERFGKDVKSGKLHAPSILLMIPYNLFRGMSLSSVPGTEYPTYDGVHWTNPVRARSYYAPAVPVPFYKRLIGEIFYRIGKLGGRMIPITYKKNAGPPNP